MRSSIAKPIIKQIKDSRDALDFFENVSLQAEDEKTREIIMNFPTVYIHNWKDSGDFEVYVGESNDIFKRTRQHYDAASDRTRWQSKLGEKDATLFIIGHEHFNKSMTLDIENRLMHYMMSVERVKHVHNLRDNPQTSYYPMEEMDEIFSKIWRGLRNENKELFPTESVIKDSAIYKASPLHIYGVTLNIRDSEGNDLNVDKQGVINVSGKSFGRGYVFPYSLTNKKFVDGFYVTGDVGRVDNEGYVCIEGRNDDFFSVGSEKTSACEIKNALLTIDDIADAVVVSEKNAGIGDIIVAYIVRKEGSLISEMDIVKRCKTFLEEYKIPRKIHFIKKVPKNQNGKMLRKYLASEVMR